eukprot:CAMPEP_0119308302 /NCGR_PEP_ID=MMETSP1333-20130426/9926_1 /TAXON_ID=418940 /ORGANISM="Scyphosphaera apsteinii, Strain RCC1455" /LENGTH=308 /DNA_ID=CAMNT_0007312035 /DNA_START=104 /DNA_END=1031 /DNA_ORIENTATION=+
MRICEPVGSDVMLEDGEEARTRQRVHLYLSDRCSGTGTLLVTTRRVVWVPEDARGLAGFSLFYPAIAMHAVCRDTSDFSHPCVYLQLDPEQNLGELTTALDFDQHSAKRARGHPIDTTQEGSCDATRTSDSAHQSVGDSTAGTEGGEEEEEEDEEEDEDAWQELRLVPVADGDGTGSTGDEIDTADAALDVIYKALCECAALNPDPDDELDGEEEDELEGALLYNNEQALAAATSEQLSMLERYDQMLATNDGRFDDAEDDQVEENDAARTAVMAQSRFREVAGCGAEHVSCLHIICVPCQRKQECLN